MILLEYEMERGRELRRVWGFVGMGALVCALVACGRVGEEAAGTQGGRLVVTGMRGGGVGAQRVVSAGTASSGKSLRGESDTYVFVLLIEDETTRSGGGGHGKVDQAAGTIEQVEDLPGNQIFFHLGKQELVLNGTTISLKKGSVVWVKVAADRRVTVVGQWKASADFAEDAVEYVKRLERTCPEVGAFLR